MQARFSLKLSGGVATAESTINKIQTTMYTSEKELSAMERAFSGVLGSEILSRGVKVIKGDIWPNRRYTEGFYNWEGNNFFADAIIEYPNGERHTLTKKLSLAR